jgi:hypothetical protein
MRTRALWVWALAGVFSIAFAMQSGGRASFAQSTSEQDQDEVVAARPFPEQANPAPPNAVLEIQVTESPQGGAGAPAPAPEQPAKQEVAAAPTDPQRKQIVAASPTDPQQKEIVAASPTDPQQKEIVDESANLMKLANSLKAEVDKTTPDMLSVAVIRQAEEIEKLAHKMRTR